ncbi:dihydrofolate reductase [Kribbella amoyensis]|uniref:Dihydrofolate reductase n=1 Tax=Kribbella amoyensis TaxID=996641 RepID=A0A561BQA8_9ACTN|nr:dihydrofolate reductase family protein [Kribbella amoyensis]TWD80994.1 dihydrofolate reductase [Kribbella amoyensis]
MRKITAGLFISLDGVVQDPDQWHFQYFNDEMGNAISALAETSDTMVLGRVTWEMFAGYWPTEGADEEGAEMMNDTPKLVVSNTLDSVDAWQNSTLLPGDPTKTLDALKEQPGKNLNIVGSVTLVRALLRARVLDELHLLVHPIAVGHGLRLFDEGETVPLELVSTTTFTTGVLHSVYAPAKG